MLCCVLCVRVVCVVLCVRVVCVLYGLCVVKVFVFELCCVVLCCVVLCCIVLCCVVLYCVVLCCVVGGKGTSIPSHTAARYARVYHSLSALLSDFSEYLF